MTWSGAFRTAAVCGLMIVLHYSIRPLLGWRVSIDFLVIALLFGAVRMRPGHAAIYGMAMGLVADSLAVNGFGAAALAMSVVGFGASWLKAVFFADNLALNAAFLFVGKWVFDLIVLVAGHRAVGGELVMQIVVWSPLSAAVTAVAGALALTVLRPLMELETA